MHIFDPHETAGICGESHEGESHLHPDEGLESQEKAKPPIDNEEIEE